MGARQEEPLQPGRLRVPAPISAGSGMGNVGGQRGERDMSLNPSLALTTLQQIVFQRRISLHDPM